MLSEKAGELTFASGIGRVHRECNRSEEEEEKKCIWNEKRNRVRQEDALKLLQNSCFIML